VVVEQGLRRQKRSGAEVDKVPEEGERRDKRFIEENCLALERKCLCRWRGRFSAIQRGRSQLTHAEAGGEAASDARGRLGRESSWRRRG
jgi:hypothetical protein